MMRTDFMRLAGLICCFLTIPIRANQVAANHAGGDDWHVDVSEVIALNSSARDGYRIQLSYQFPDRKSVWLREVGYVQASGDLTFVYLEDRLTFRTAKDGEILASVPLQPTSFPQSSHGDEYPPPIGGPEWVLSPPPLTLEMTSQKTVEIALSALREASHGRIARTCRPDDEGCFVTPWTLVASDENLQAEVSVLVTFKDNQGRNPTILKIFFVKRQGYRGSSRTNPSGDMVDGAAPIFLSNLRQLILKQK